MKERKNFIEKSFMDKLENVHKERKIFTENMALAYATSGAKILDFNFKLSQFRAMDEKEIMKAFTQVYFEDPTNAIKFVFYVGDVREGLGERKTFRACMKWLALNKPEVCKAVLHLIPEYTRWDNLILLIEVPEVKDDVMNIIKEQLRKDYVDAQAGNSISLLAKWMPSINASSKDTRAKANMIIRWLNVSPKEYRKTLSTLRAYLDVVEVKASSNKWSEIDYKAVPSQANLKYKDAFLKHDRDRRIVYLDNLSAGKAKINASVVQPHEIVSKYTYECRQAPYISDTILYDETYEQMWKALPNIVVEDTLVVRDGSYSMASCAGNSRISCLDVATALAIYCSEHNSPAWADKFITFSSHPEVVNLKHCTSLKDKLNVCRSHSDCSNTDIARTMRLILRTAVENNISQEEMPRNILIVSDMQFDGVWNRNKSWNKTLFECIAIEYDSFGYKLPRMIFWNVCDRNTNTIPMQDNENGLILCSGFSINAMKMFMSGEIDPLKVLLSQLDTPRYKPVEKALEKVM